VSKKIELTICERYAGCSTCRAQPGEPCRDGTSGAPRKSHGKRISDYMLSSIKPGVVADSLDVHDAFCLDLEYGWHDEDGRFQAPAGAAAHAQYHRRQSTGRQEGSGRA